MKKLISLILLVVFMYCNNLQSFADATQTNTLLDIKGHWAEESIQTLFEKKYITGNEQGKYEPNKAITRAEFIALLTRFETPEAIYSTDKVQGSSFSSPGYEKYWARPYIEIAVKFGIIIPEEIGSDFRGSEPLKRYDMAMMLTRARYRLDKVTSVNIKNPFSDMPGANDEVLKLYYDDGIFKGYAENGKVLFKPNGSATKAEAATVIKRLYDVRYRMETFEDQAHLDRHYNVLQPDEIEQIRATELKKQSESGTYVMEPIVMLQYNKAPYDGWYLKFNLENAKDYADGSSIKVECVTIPGLNDSYSEYKPLGSKITDTKVYELKSNNDKIKLIPGMELEYKITVKHGNQTKEIVKRVSVPKFTR